MYFTSSVLTYLPQWSSHNLQSFHNKNVLVCSTCLCSTYGSSRFLSKMHAVSQPVSRKFSNYSICNLLAFPKNNWLLCKIFFFIITARSYPASRVLSFIILSTAQHHRSRDCFEYYATANLTPNPCLL